MEPSPKADGPASRCVSARSFDQSEDVLLAERSAVLAESLPVLNHILALLLNLQHHTRVKAERGANTRSAKPVRLAGRSLSIKQTKDGLEKKKLFE